MYRRHQQCQQEGEEGLEPQPSKRRQFWNRRPEPVCDQIVQLVRAHPEKPARQLAWLFNPFRPEGTARRVNELWQTDFTYFKIQGWGWYYLSTVLDDYSRYILAWRLTPPWRPGTSRRRLGRLRRVPASTGVGVFRPHPRLLPDNGPSYMSGELRRLMESRQIEHARGAPYCAMTQGRIERCQRSMKNLVQRQTFQYP